MFSLKSLKSISSVSDTLKLFDNRGHHKPHNNIAQEKEVMTSHIEKYPKYQSHYSRRHTNKFYFPLYI